MPTAQQNFDREYITSVEICRRLGISKSQITHAKKSRGLPKPIKIKNCRLAIWNRSQMEPFVVAWKKELVARKAARKN